MGGVNLLREYKLDIKYQKKSWLKYLVYKNLYFYYSVVSLTQIITIIEKWITLEYEITKKLLLICRYGWWDWKDNAQARRPRSQEPKFSRCKYLL